MDHPTNGTQYDAPLFALTDSEDAHEMAKACIALLEDVDTDAPLMTFHDGPVGGRRMSHPSSFYEQFSGSVDQHHGPIFASGDSEHLPSKGRSGTPTASSDAVLSYAQNGQSVQHLGHPPNSTKSRNVYIAWLPRTFTSNELHTLGASFGDVESVRLVEDTGRTYGFILFRNHVDATHAVSELNRQKLCGRKLQARLSAVHDGTRVMAPRHPLPVAHPTAPPQPPQPSMPMPLHYHTPHHQLRPTPAQPLMIGQPNIQSISMANPAGAQYVTVLPMPGNGQSALQFIQSVQPTPYPMQFAMPSQHTAPGHPQQLLFVAAHGGGAPQLAAGPPPGWSYVAVAPA